MKKLGLFAVVLAYATLSVNAFALDKCESDFRRGLSEMKQLFGRLSPACQKQVNIGDTNQDKIQATCKGQEIDVALSMKGIKMSQLRPLCLDAACGSLKARGVCVEGKTFSYYLSKFNM